MAKKREKEALEAQRKATIKEKEAQVRDLTFGFFQHWDCNKINKEKLLEAHLTNFVSDLNQTSRATPCRSGRGPNVNKL